MIFKSIIPSAKIPDVDLPSFLFDTSKVNGVPADRPAYIDIASGQQQTHGELWCMANEVASGLINKLGINRGDVVAIFSPNHIHYASCEIGIMIAGSICVTIGSFYGAKDLEFQLNDSKAKVLIVGEEQVPVVIKALEGGSIAIPSERIFVILQKGSSPVFNAISELLCDLPFNPLKLTSINESSSTAALIIHTSGTTGTPKGAMLSHRNLVGALSKIGPAIKFNQAPSTPSYSESSVIKAIISRHFAFLYGQISSVLGSVQYGSTQYILNDPSIDTLLAAIDRYSINWVYLIPYELAQIVKHPNLQKYNLTSLKLCICGGTSLSSEVHIKAVSKLPGVSILNGYGITESAGGISLMSTRDFDPKSVGFLYPEIEAKIIDPAGNELGYDQEGELCLRGPTIMMGYANRPEESAKVFDKDGFFHTGDSVYIDKNNRVYFVERIKDIIKYKGMEVPPIELESILLENEKVADVAVIGVQDDEQQTELVKAYVVLSDSVVKRVHKNETSKEVICSELALWVKDNVYSNKWLYGGVEIIEKIPRNVNGKILRSELCAREITKRTHKQ